MTLESLITEANERGFLLNNLFQLSSGLWQANLRNATHGTEFGRGYSATDALSDAIDKMDLRYPLAPNQAGHSIASTPLDLSALLNLLGVANKQASGLPPITRR